MRWIEKAVASDRSRCRPTACQVRLPERSGDGPLPVVHCRTSPPPGTRVRAPREVSKVKVAFQGLPPIGKFTNSRPPDVVVVSQSGPMQGGAWGKKPAGPLNVKNSAVMSACTIVAPAGTAKAKVAAVQSAANRLVGFIAAALLPILNS